MQGALECRPGPTPMIDLQPQFLLSPDTDPAPCYLLSLCLRVGLLGNREALPSIPPPSQGCPWEAQQQVAGW